MIHSRIEVRHLRYFVALAEELHFGRAAERCNISQPPFSVAIRQLEAELGFDLVDRSRTPLQLTHSGKVFYDETLRGMAQLTHAVQAASLVNAGMSGIIRVGFFGSLLSRGLATVLQQYERERPDVQIQLIELNTKEQLNALQRGAIDYGFLHTSVTPEGIVCEELVSEPFVVCVHANHPLAARSSIHLRNVANERLILFPRSVSPTYYDQLISLCHRAGFQPRIEHEVRHWLTAVAIVGRALGVAIVPQSMHNAEILNVVYLPLNDVCVQPQLWTARPQRSLSDPSMSHFHSAVKTSMGISTSFEHP
jgi:DNA-binding transcriptional LysR family regulator